MHLENNPMFRKAPVPWYDSGIACIIGAFVTLGIALFATVGIRVAAVYHEPWILWVPSLLFVCSAGLFIPLVIRFSRRRKSEK